MNLESLIAHQVGIDRLWLPHDRRGRWGVLEHGAGTYLKGIAAHLREIADMASPRRARRFSSLSQARSFARLVGGEVFRWRRTPPGGGRWKRVTPWERALKSLQYPYPLPRFVR